MLNVGKAQLNTTLLGHKVETTLLGHNVKNYFQQKQHSLWTNI